MFSCVKHDISRAQYFRITINVSHTTFIADEANDRHYTVPQHHLSYLDKITLKLFGNIKGEIPTEVR